MCLPITKTGRVTFRIFDLHSLHNRFYFPKDKVAVKMESGISLLLSRIDPNTTIVFPDDGAHKRFRTYFSEFKVIVCSKVREGEKRVVTIKDTYNISAQDKSYLDNMLIVDDLVQTGGTLEECRKALVSLGAKQVSCYVTHAVFPKMAYKKFVGKEFHKFYITNTIPEISNKLENIAPFEVIHIEDEIIKSLNNSFQFCDVDNKIKHLNIYVGSTNQTKMRSTYLACKEFLKDVKNVKIHVYGVGVPSEVPEQPVGIQTDVGCSNRLTNLQKYVEHYNLPYDLLISVENGINLENDKSYDFAVVKLKSNFNEILCKSDNHTYFPKEFYDMSISNNQTVTVGNLIEKKLNIKIGTWHEQYGSKTREVDLKETITIALKDGNLQLL